MSETPTVSSSDSKRRGSAAPVDLESGVTSGSKIDRTVEKQMSSLSAEIASGPDRVQWDQLTEMVKHLTKSNLDRLTQILA